VVAVSDAPAAGGLFVSLRQRMPPFRRIVATLLVFACGGCGPRSEPEPITIGQLIPLSGPQKQTGERARNGAGLAVEVALRKGRRVLGRKVAVRHVDTRGEADLVPAEAVRLLTLNRVVAVLGGPEPSAGEPLARAVQSYGVPVVLTADLASVPVNEAAFCLNAAPETRGEALARYAARGLHCRHVVVLTDDHAGPGAALAASFVKRWRQERRDDKQARVDEWACQKDDEWNELFSRTVAAQPDGVLLAVGSGEFARLQTRLVAAGYKAALLYGGEDRGTETLPEPPREGPAAFLATAFSVRAELGDTGQAFIREYAEKFQEPPDLAAALAYDGVLLLIDALERAKTAQPGRPGEELAAVTDFHGVTGPLSFANRRAKRPVFVVKFEAGEAKVVDTFGPGAE
jgi:branched-chain amino acid transport system substrate-binding protein